MTGLVQPSCMAIDESHVYLGIEGSIVRVPLNGGSAELVAPGVLGPIAIAVDAMSVYWADDGGGGDFDTVGGTIRKTSK